MDHLNGHVRRLPGDFQEIHLPSNPTEPYVVPPITPSTRKSADRSVVAQCGCSMLRGLGIAAAVLCARSVKKAVVPASPGGSAPCSGRSLPTDLLWLNR